MARFGRVMPTIPVTHIDHALQFYRGVLGFAVAFTNGDPVSFAVIKQGDSELHLVVQPDKAGSTHAHLMVDDLDGIHELYASRHSLRRRPRFSRGGCVICSLPTRTGTLLRSPNP